MILRKYAFKNIERTGENASNQLFLFFPQSFLPFPKQISSANSHLFCRLKCFQLSKFLSFGKGLTLSQTSPGFYLSALEVF